MGLRAAIRSWSGRRRKHRRTHWKELSRRYHDRRGWPTIEEITLFDPEKVRTTRYRMGSAFGQGRSVEAQHRQLAASVPLWGLRHSIFSHSLTDTLFGT